MKITRLEVDSFKRVKAISISPNGNAVVIGGANGVGKSSALDAIEAALGGTKHVPDEPIRKGQKKARVVVETEEFVATRNFTPKGSTLEVKAKDGSTYPSPQALLDGLVGKLSFDPLTFSRQDAKAQAAILRQLVGLDFTTADQQRQAAYDERTEVGREIKRLQGALDKLPEAPAGAPDVEVSVADLLAEVSRRQRHNDDNEAQRRQLVALRQDAVKAANEVERIEASLADAKAERERIREMGLALRAEVDRLVDIDVATVREQITGAEQTNAAVRLKQGRTKLEAELEERLTESQLCTEKITAIDAQKADAAAKAQYPIDGLAVSDAGVILAGVPFEQASQAEKLRASVAIGLALNPRLKVLLIRDGALLDEKSLATVQKMATDADAQVWVEVVGNRNEVTVLIEDGEVAQPHHERNDGKQPAAGIA